MAKTTEERHLEQGFDTPHSHLDQVMNLKEPYYPDLSDVAKADDVSKKGGGGFQAEYINWAKTMQMLREHAPGWQPEAVTVKIRPPEGAWAFADGTEIVHQAPDGSGYLMIRFVHASGRTTQAVPHAIMDNRNNAKKGDTIDARDVSDAFVRGACKAAALLFGLAWQMWSKDDPMERSNPRASAAVTKAKAIEDAANEGQVAVFLAEEFVAAIEATKSRDELVQLGYKIQARGFKGADRDIIAAAYEKRLGFFGEEVK